ncbi:MAG: GSCFA domain-containing protein [Muribaculaceae bacterium]|nr:GSCFA domain-containing protein [Muribaculaceae bacterium]
MRFRTEYKAEKAIFSLDPGKPLVLLGSCFSQNMAKKMEDHLWEAVNPAGTLYNPISIYKAVELLLTGDTKKFEQSLFEFNGIWNSRYFDSSFSSRNRIDSIEEFNNRSRQFQDKLKEGRQLIVTFGTSICYCSAENDEVVGNCHKLPSPNFYTRRMVPEEIGRLWKEMIDRLNVAIPDIRIVFTVSPVRHLKNGFVGNSRSKAVLQLGVEEICVNRENCCYFPAYEILNDDLRDYRFYASDLAHPSEEAIEYIWEKFLETFVDSAGFRLLEEGAKRVKSARHRPHPGALGKSL